MTRVETCAGHGPRWCVLPTEVVQDVGHGSLKKGERVLDLFVKKVCDNTQHQKLLPPKT